MADPAAGVAPDSCLFNSLQALLAEMKSQSDSQKGKLRWSLQKRVESDPSCSVLLIRALVKELETELKRDVGTPSNTHIIPMLHTLYYVVFLSGVTVPTSLFQTAYECLMKLLILPSPYSAVALSTLRSIKMEMTTPGSLYQRRVIAEQNLKSEHFASYEKVFVLADRAVFSAPMEAKVRALLQPSSLTRSTSDLERNVVLRLLQTGLGTMCQSSRLAQALEALGDHLVEKYFQEVVLAVEQSIKHGAGGRADYLITLQHIYRDILTASKEDITKLHDSPPACSPAAPFPKINFLLWRDKDSLWNLLANLSPRSRPNSGVDKEQKNKRDSAQSESSGMQRGVEKRDFDVTEINTKPADKPNLMREKIEAFPGSSPVCRGERRRHTVRVVVMGDDRVLGRLGREYHYIQEKESRCLILTKNLNLQLYYVPVTDEEPSLRSPDSRGQDEGRLSLASLLGRVDPWYNTNINSLRAVICKPAQKQHSKRNKPSEQNLFLLDTLCYYLRCGTQPVNLPLYSVKMTRSSCGVSSVVEEVFVSQLEADVPEFRHLKEERKESSGRRRKSTTEVFGAVISVSYTKMSLSKREIVQGEAPMTCGVVITSEPAAVTSGEDCLAVRFDSLGSGCCSKIQTQNINIRTMEHRRLSVCLDKDSRRTYTDIQRIEISPCPDPRRSVLSTFTVSNERELLLNKYLDKVLSLPVNTFTGVSL